MADICIPAGPIDIDPYDAIRATGEETPDEANAAALADALQDITLGAADKDFLDWLSDRPSSTVAMVCSLIGRARAAAVEGRIVLDEPTELGLTYDTGADLLTLEPPFVAIHTAGSNVIVIPDADEADEWAAHLAGMARALRAKAAAASTPPAAIASAVLRRALDLLQGRDVVGAIQAAAGDDQLADAALRELADYCGYDQLDQAADSITRWQQTTGLHTIRGTLPHAADHAEREGR